MSENILKELCNRLLNLFKQTENPEENAKEVACNRLRVVLMQDRTNLTPELLERMRGELVELLSKYVEMDKDALELNFDHEDGQMALMLSIPVIRAKDEEEIQEALKAEKEEAEAAAEEEAEAEEKDDDDSEDADNSNAESEDNENSEEDEASEDNSTKDETENNNKNLQEDEKIEEEK